MSSSSLLVSYHALAFLPSLSSLRVARLALGLLRNYLLSHTALAHSPCCLLGVVLLRVTQHNHVLSRVPSLRGRPTLSCRLDTQHGRHLMVSTGPRPHALHAIHHLTNLRISVGRHGAHRHPHRSSPSFTRTFLLRRSSSRHIGGRCTKGWPLHRASALAAGHRVRQPHPSFYCTRSSSRLSIRAPPPPVRRLRRFGGRSGRAIGV